MLYPIAFFEREKKTDTRMSKLWGSPISVYSSLWSLKKNIYSEKDLENILGKIPYPDRSEVMFIDNMGDKKSFYEVKNMIDQKKGVEDFDWAKYRFRRRRRRYYPFRYVKTHQEIGENKNLKILQKETTEEYGVRIKTRERNLPNSWDDVPKCAQVSWKKHRKTQYKVVQM